MNIAQYCKNKGMNLEQYKQCQANIKAAAETIVSVIKAMYRTNTGVYHPVNEIMPNIPGKTDENIKAFIIQDLKTLGVEFIENNTYWRY